MEALVTGATGLLGNNLVRRLLQQGHRVRVLVRGTTAGEPLAGLGVESIAGDLDDQPALERAIVGAEVVFHVAGFVRIGWSDLPEARRVNVEGSRRVAQLVRRHQGRLVHVSSVNTLAVARRGTLADEETPVSGQVPSAYVISKREADAAVRAEMAMGLDGVIVHPGFMLGRWDWKPSSGRMLLDVAQKRPPLAPPGGCSVCHVEDVVAGVLSAAERGRRGESYILAGQNVSYLELWRAMAQRAGVRAPVGVFPLWIGRGIGAVTDRWHRWRGCEGDINGAAIEMGAQWHHYSSAKAEHELGYRFGEMQRAVDDAWQWFEERGSASAPRAHR